MIARWKLLLTAIMLAATGPALALQVVDPVEGKNSFIKISAKELTRIAVENGRLRSIVATEGDLMIEKDEERGQAFVRPLVLDKPINVRIITGSGSTYSVIMQPVDMPQEDVIVRERAARTGDQGDRTTSYERNLKALVAAMAADEPPSNVDMKRVGQEFALWEGTRFILESVFLDRGMTGEKYSLHNIGKDRIRIAEQELYRKGVLAVAIESMTLDPGQSTWVFVVRSE
jgi:conjugal transfer pilus assembly protein TraK